MSGPSPQAGQAPPHGQGEASKVVVVFFDDTGSTPAPIGEPQTIERIAAGGSGQAQVVDDPTGKAGQRAIRVGADPNNAIPESNEEDNAATRILTISESSSKKAAGVALARNLVGSPSGSRYGGG